MLLVEDNAADAELVVEMLAAGGNFDIDVVTSLAEAVEVAEREPPECVLLDLSLPDARGLDGVREISRRFPTLPLVVLTGARNKDLAADAIRAGARDYLEKDGADTAAVIQSIRSATAHALESDHGPEETRSRARSGELAEAADAVELTRVLLVEDSEADVELVSEMLLADGRTRFEVDVVTSLGAALEAVERAGIDCVLLDLSLADTQGLDGLRRLSEHRPGLPIVVLTGTAGEELGVEAIHAGAQDYLTKGTVAAETLAQAVRYATARSKLLERLEDVVRTDELTGVANRRAWQGALPRELALADRSDAPLSVALIDLDNFKEYNDAHGHRAGDSLLREASASWRRRLRLTDQIARLGGDEFAILLPSSTASEALEVVERLLADTPRDETASAGIAQWEKGERAGDLTERADQALYRAKEAGRDRVEVAEDP